jgi:hypothetical protein
VVTPSDACDESDRSVKYRLKTPNDVSSDSVQDSVAIINPTDGEGLDNGVQSIEFQRAAH